MRIDALKTSPDRAGRYWATFDNGERIGFYRQTVEDFGLRTGLELSDEEFSRLLSAAGKMSARMRAVRIVSMSGVSRRELEDRLVRKGEDPDQAREAVEWMAELKLVDDRAAAQGIVRSCIAKGYGRARARQALYEKRIPKELWEDALADYPDQQESITAFLRARIGPEADGKQVKRAVDALLRRGHSYGDIRRALSTLSLPEEDILEE